MIRNKLNSNSIIADKEKDIQAGTEKIRQQLNESYRQQEELSNQITSLKVCFFFLYTKNYIQGDFID